MRVRVRVLMLLLLLLLPLFLHADLIPKEIGVHVHEWTLAKQLRTGRSPVPSDLRQLERARQNRPVQQCTGETESPWAARPVRLPLVRGVQARRRYRLARKAASQLVLEFTWGGGGA